MVEACKESLGAQAVGNALYGLQGMSSDRPEVLELLSALPGNLVGSNESLAAHAVGNALYGLQGMSSDRPEVLRLLSALADKVKV